MEEQSIQGHAQGTNLQQELVMMFELLIEEGGHDPALINAVGNEIVAFLQKEGYRIQPPIYTGEKGIESFLVEFVATLQQVATNVRVNHAGIAEGIADLGGLVTIFAGILPLLKRVRQEQEKRKEETTSPIRLTVEIDGSPLTIEASDLAEADAVLKLALKYRSVYPKKAAQVTTRSSVKVQVRQPPRKRRSRR